MLLLLAEEGAKAVAGFDTSTLMPSISAIGSLGFAIWFAWYTTVYTLPLMQKEHREERASDRNAFLNELKDAREAYDRWKSKS